MKNQYEIDYQQGYDKANEEWLERLDKIRAEILDNAFSVVNPHNTYEYINVIDLDSIDKIFYKYEAETEAEDGTNEK